MTVARSIFVGIVVIGCFFWVACSRNQNRTENWEGKATGRIRLINETRDIDVYKGACDKFAHRTVSLSSVVATLSADRTLAYDRSTRCGGYYVYYIKGHGIDGWVKGSKINTTIPTVKSAVNRSQFIEVTEVSYGTVSQLPAASSSQPPDVAPEPEPVTSPPQEMEPAQPVSLEAVSEQPTQPAMTAPSEETIGTRSLEPAQPVAEQTGDVMASPPPVDPVSQEVEVMTQRDYEKELEMELQRERQKEKELESQLK